MRSEPISGPRSKALAPLALGLVACSSPAAPQPVTIVDLAPTGRESAEPTAPSSPRDAGGVPQREHPGASHPLARWIDVEQPGELACVFAEDALQFEEALALTATARPFAEVTSRGALVARLGVGATRFVVDLEASGVFLRGFATPDAVPLYARRPLVFAEFVAPQPHLALGVTSTGKDALTLSMGQFGAELGAKPTRASRCADVGMSVASFDARDAFPREGEPGELVGTAIPLALTADEGWEFRLSPGDEDARAIEVIESRGARARVVWETDGFVASGWIPTANVKMGMEPLPGSLHGIGSLGLDGTGAGGIPAVHVCPVDVSLAVEMDGERRVAGYVRRETPMFEAGTTRGKLTAVSFVHSDIRPAEGALFLVDGSVLARCPLR